MTAPLRGEQKLPFFTHFSTGGTYEGCSNKISFILIFQIKIDISSTLLIRLFNNQIIKYIWIGAVYK